MCMHTAKAMIVGYLCSTETTVIVQCGLKGCFVTLGNVTSETPSHRVYSYDALLN